MVAQVAIQQRVWISDLGHPVSPWCRSEDDALPRPSAFQSVPRCRRPPCGRIWLLFGVLGLGGLDRLKPLIGRGGHNVGGAPVIALLLEGDIKFHPTTSTSWFRVKVRNLVDWVATVRGCHNIIFFLKTPHLDCRVVVCWWLFNDVPSRHLTVGLFILARGGGNVGIFFAR